MGNFKIVERVYMGECVNRSRKRWIESVNACLKKVGFNVGQVRRIVYDRNELGVRGL